MASTRPEITVAMTALRESDQGNEVWANAGVTLT
jgi:hypothetical protein